MSGSATAQTHAQPRSAAQPRGRVASLDLLRGLCAIAVATYHALRWNGIASLYNLGLYGVYIFFLLSGASMTIAYARRLESGYRITDYLKLRYVRLAPLYGAVAVYAALTDVPAQTSRVGLLGKWLLNASFLFGFANPGRTSLVTGGWSLGIEFVFYLVFPLMLAVLAGRAAPWVVAAAIAAQLIFVNVVLAGSTLDGAWVEYTQFAAFVGYFAFGTWMGRCLVAGQLAPSRAQPLSWIAWLAVLAVIGSQSGSTAEASLVGARGALLTLGCCLLLLVTITLDGPKPLRPVATWLGDASYPMYLIHPIVYRSLEDVRALSAWRAQHRAGFVVVVLAVSFLLATLIYRLFEEPILKWGKARIGRSRPT